MRIWSMAIGILGAVIGAAGIANLLSDLPPYLSAFPSTSYASTRPRMPFCATRIHGRWRRGPWRLV
jgi:hypothetical protein